MGDVVNLRTARKNRARSEAERQAEENRLRFGRTKAEKQKQIAEEARRTTLLEAHRRENNEP